MKKRFVAMSPYDCTGKDCRDILMSAPGMLCKSHNLLHKQAFKVYDSSSQSTTKRTSRK